jgi:GTP-binding protein EngB required for normal cell division
VFTDAEMLKVVMTAMQKLDKKRANNMAKQSAKEDDSEILDNEALLQASIEENAETKSGKKAVKKIMKNK